MSTIKNELSKKNPYWLPKDRYLELKHFCLQYPIWKKALEALNGLSHRPEDLAIFESDGFGDPTAKCAEAREFYLKKLSLVDITLGDACFRRIPSRFLYYGVVDGMSYDKLNAKFSIGVCISRSKWYELYRKFFWLLNKSRE